MGGITYLGSGWAKGLFDLKCIKADPSCVCVCVRLKPSFENVVLQQQNTHEN